jgi:hypothetical protein
MEGVLPLRFYCPNCRLYLRNLIVSPRYQLLCGVCGSVVRPVPMPSSRDTETPADQLPTSSTLSSESSPASQGG